MSAAIAPSAKVLLRAALRERRRRFVAGLDDRSGHERRIAAIVLEQLGGARCVAVYLAQGSEVDTAPLIEALAASRTIIALPHSLDRAASPAFHRWTEGEPLVSGPFGVRQPDAEAIGVLPDAIVAPLLGFDRFRIRLGQGAGWYDRAFAVLPDARRIGLGWSVQEEPALPRDTWDVPLHAVVTEEGLR